MAENLKLGGPSLIIFLAQLINKIIETKSIPENIKYVIIHLIYKKDKKANISGNYRGITIISIICKVLDIIQDQHQESAIPPNKNDLQFSFIKGRSPLHATIIISEILAEAKDGKTKLLGASLDIPKAFDVISHPHLLRKLYLAGLTGRWWIMKDNTYTNMCSRVTWKSECRK